MAKGLFCAYKVKNSVNCFQAAHPMLSRPLEKSSYDVGDQNRAGRILVGLRKGCKHRSSSDLTCSQVKLRERGRRKTCGEGADTHFPGCLHLRK
eukprot:3725325-Amphidinium_carterae.1